MEKIITFLKGILENSGIECKNIEIFEDENGILTITVKKESDKIEKIKSELDSIDDDIFIEAAESFKEQNPEYFQILKDIDEIKDEGKIIYAYNVFKTHVKNIVLKRIDKLNNQIEDYYKKYIQED